MYVEGKPKSVKSKEVGLGKQKLSSSMTLIRVKKKSRGAVRTLTKTNYGKLVLKRCELRRIKDKILVANREMRVENVKEIQTEKSNEMRADNGEGREREEKGKDIVDTTPTGSGTAEPKARPIVELLKSGV